ncbi:MAG: hypothetical protein ACRD0P_08720 [Stackebrandtia sp.]
MNMVVGISSEQRDKYRRMLAWVVCAAVIAGVGWTGASCLRQSPDDPRAMTTAEATRLSRVSLNNVDAGTVPFSAELPDSAGGGGIDGRVDWSQSLVHAALTKAGKSKPYGLVQAIPGLVAQRPGTTSADADTPADGWTVRHISPSESEPAEKDTGVIDIVMSAILTLRAETAADPAILKAKGSWLRQGVIDGATVDVFRAPLLLDAGAGASKGKKVPEAVFWVDDDSRLRRVQFDPGTKDLATVDFLLSQKDVKSVHPVDLLGGPPIEPRKVSKTEAETLAGLRQRNSMGGAEASIVLPVADGKVIRAEGYVDWRMPMAYLAVDAPGKKNDGLLFVLPSGAATLTSTVDGKPPLTPQTSGWKAQEWSQRTEDGKASDLDTLLFKVLAMSNSQGDDTATVKDKAAWLRDDKLGGTAAEVFEFPISGDPDTDKPGQAPFRYWIGAKDDALHRIEMRTGELGMAHADLAPQSPPASVVIPPPVIAGLG